MDLFLTSNYFIFPALIWTLFWKGFSLWTAVKNDHRKWFVALLVLNTFGILDIFYIFHIAKKNWSDVKDILQYSMRSKKENSNTMEVKAEELK